MTLSATQTRQRSLDLTFTLSAIATAAFLVGGLGPCGHAGICHPVERGVGTLCAAITALSAIALLVSATRQAIRDAIDHTDSPR